MELAFNWTWNCILGAAFLFNTRNYLPEVINIQTQSGVEYYTTEGE